MNFNIELDHTTRIILYRHKGLLRKKEIGEAWQELLKINEFTVGKYNLLSDYLEAQFRLGTNDVQLISNFLFSLKDILKDKKQALVVQDPKSTAISMLFEMDVIEKVGFLVKTFSTRNAALIWLN